MFVITLLSGILNRKQKQKSKEREKLAILTMKSQKPQQILVSVVNLGTF